MSNNVITRLHCFPCGPRNYTPRERERLERCLKPVRGCTTLISLPHACLVAGLLEDVRKGVAINSIILDTLVKQKWDGSVDRFLADAATIGVSPATADKTVGGLLGAVIGWSGRRGTSCDDRNSEFGLCPDLNWALAILSRRAGDIFIAAREPDYSWTQLFGSQFEFDDDLSPSVPLEGEPWSRFKWAVAGTSKTKQKPPKRSSRAGRSSMYGWGHA